MQNPVAITSHLATAAQSLSEAVVATVNRHHPANVEALIKETYTALDMALHQVRGCPEGDPEEHPLSAFITPDQYLPRFYDTVMGWTAKNNPGRLLRQMDNPVEDTKRDGFALSARAKRQDLSLPKVPAPKALREHGITEVNAYPVSWIKARCGETAAS